MLSQQVPLVDQHAWSDLDLFDFNVLSSAPSWVSDADRIDPIQTIPTLVTDNQTQASSKPFVSFAEGIGCQQYDPIPRPQDDSPSSQSTQIINLLTRADQVNLSPHSHYKLPGQSSHHTSLLSSEPFVDNAFALNSPSSPVLSENCPTKIETYVPHLASFAPPQVAPLPQSTPIFDQTTIQAHIPNYPFTSHTRNHSNATATDSLSSQGTSSAPTAAVMRSSVPRTKAMNTNRSRNAHHTFSGRVQKQTRRYSAPKSSRYCHLCARHERCVEMVPCGNVELGLCQKSVCRKCIDVYNLVVDSPSWSCPHCQNKCPQRAKCFAYDRQTARRREKTLRAKMNSLSGRNNKTRRLEP